MNVNRIRRMTIALFAAFFTLVVVHTAEAGTGVFTDVPDDYFAKEGIEFLFHADVIRGYENDDGSRYFSPGANITRDQMVSMMDGVIDTSDAGSLPSVSSFNDVDRDYWASDQMERLHALGVIQGDSNGNFRPRDSLTRAQAALILYRSFDLPSEEGGTPFEDVREDFHAAVEINALRGNGVIGGDQNNRFRPNESITRAQFAAMLNNVMNLPEDEKTETEQAEEEAPEPEGSEEKPEELENLKLLYEAKTTPPSLNVRSSAGVTSDNRLGALNEGTVVQVFGESGNWAIIAFRDSFAYVSMNFLDRIEEEKEEAPEEDLVEDIEIPDEQKDPDEVSKDVEKRGTVTATVLNVRDRPGTNGTNVVGQLRNGQSVVVLEVKDGWAKVLFNGRERYASASFLAIREVSSSRLEGKIIVIDPGHGGRDPGATIRDSQGTLHEKDVVLPPSLLLRDKLVADGAIVVMTRTGDTFPSLDARVNIANQNHADLFVSVHANAFNGRAKGSETFWNRTHAARDSERIAHLMQNQIVSQLGLSYRRVAEANFRVIRGTNMPSTLVELGFMDNAEDLAIIRSSTFNERSAEAMYQAIREFFE